MRPTVVILTFNSEDSLANTLSRALLISDEIFIVDSFSKDGTADLARSMGATVVEHAFLDYGAQRNWAIDNLPITREWQLHLDADEVLDDRLVDAILSLSEEQECTGFFLARYLRFLGRVLRHGGMSPTWHLRLFRTGIGRCEDRKYDQHFLVNSGKTTRLAGSMIDDMRMPLTEWTARHNRWSDGEVEEMQIQELQNHPTEGRVRPDPMGNPAQRKRFLRQIFNRSPLFVRPVALFIYRYFFRLGFLDRMEGTIYWVLQTFWFRFLVDAKIWERQNADRVNAPLVLPRSR